MDGDCRRWRGEESEGHGASELRGSKSAQHWARVEREDRGNWICKGVNPSNIEIQSRAGMWHFQAASKSRRQVLRYRGSAHCIKMAKVCINMIHMLLGIYND
jgi:hypothetical protein